jgi:hypothetical protein
MDRTTRARRHGLGGRLQVRACVTDGNPPPRNHCSWRSTPRLRAEHGALPTGWCLFPVLGRSVQQGDSRPPGRPGRSYAALASGVHPRPI